MAPEPFDGRKTFTVDQANAALPLVRAIVQDWSHLSADVAERSERVAAMLARRANQKDDPYAEELRQVERDLQCDAARLNELVGELVELGIHPKSGTDGLIDFPALLDGRPVYLCWKLDEPEVRFWHEVDAGFSGRRSLMADSSVSDAEASERAADFGSPARDAS